mgnify:CR=1 FL=1
MAQPQIKPQDDRRSVTRFVVDCPAQFRMVGSVLPGRLSDLSELGARFECAHPPVQGMSGMLTWNGSEHFCTVVWTRGPSCGLVFERAIPLSMVEATMQEIEVYRGPVANFGNIPIAPRRSRRFGMVEE